MTAVYIVLDCFIRNLENMLPYGSLTLVSLGLNIIIMQNHYKLAYGFLLKIPLILNLSHHLFKDAKIQSTGSMNY